MPIAADVKCEQNMRVLTVGSAMVDTIAIIDSGRIERMTMLNADSSFLLLEEGRKTEAVEVSTHSGGGAVNVAVAIARLGIDRLFGVASIQRAAFADTPNHALFKPTPSPWTTSQCCWMDEITGKPTVKCYQARTRAEVLTNRQ